ncbi:MAG TPA: hypothetical protein VMT16_10640 [Thermoanaerobaculia bacterium]|nr:hypothetical protein [Thermoanaerobaculia bacterium]
MSRRDALPVPWEAAPGTFLLPIAHDRLDVAPLVRQALTAVDPAAVAVELPTTLAAAAEAAVARLPRISLIVSEEPDEDALVWVVAPGDPLAEALRWALEHGRRRFYVDPDVRYRERHRDPLPDPWAAWELGDEYLRLLAAAAGAGPGGEEDLLREAGMAHHLQGARREVGEGVILALLGAAHVRRVGERLAAPTAIPLARRQRQEVSVLHLHPESLSGLLLDPPLAHACWELLRGGELPATSELGAAVARRISLVRGGLRLFSRQTVEAPERRRRLVSWAARQAARQTQGGVLAPDRRRLASAVWEAGVANHDEHAREALAPWQRRVFFDFARRHARVQGLLVPGLFEWVVAARGVADDNFAWEVFSVARTYPWQEEEAELPTVRVDGDELDLGTRRVRFRRRFFRVKQRPVRVPVRERAETDDPLEWLAGFDGGLCSHPPEDVEVEGYGRYLQQKAISILSAERRRSQPFVAGMLDGLDIRETLRHWHDGQVWVEERGRVPGDAGSVVVIFDRDDEGSRYPFLMTWLGEHDQESDMAFYSTDPADQIVGPGIVRATYGGFLLTMPPGRLADVWQDPDYQGLGGKPEVLLAAAIDYSEEPIVVHVGRTPPAETLRRHAAAQGKRIVHIPLGSLSQGTLRKLRVVHLLAGRDKREIAERYVW